MRLLVDGYNLMHAAGYLTARPTRRLEPIRLRFLDWLAAVAAKRAVPVRVVFDGQNAPRSSPEADYRGVRVRFAHDQTADDEIELLLTEPSRDVVVVSNDARLHESARRAHAAPWSCDRFLDWVIQEDAVRVPRAAEPENPRISDDENAKLLATFLEPRRR